MDLGKWVTAGLVIISVVLSGETNEAEEASDTCVWVGVEVNLECKHNGSESCETPEKPLYGGYDNTTNGNIYKAGDTIRYYCHRGYRLIGQSNRMCTGTRNGWQPHEPYCEPEYIGHLMRRLDGIEDKLNVNERRKTEENNTLKTVDKISAIDNDISAMRNNLSAIDNKVLAMDMRFSASDKNVSAIGDTISATNSRMSTIDEMMSIMNDTISAMNNKILALEGRVATNDNKVSAVDNKVSAVDNKVSAVDNKVSAVDNKVSAVDNKVSAVDNKVSIVDNKVSAVDNKVSTVDNKVSAVDNKVSAVDNKVSIVDNKVSAVDNKVSAVDNKVSAVDNKILAVDKTFSYTESGVSSFDLCLSLLGPYNCSMDQIKERLTACANDSNPINAEVVSKCLTMQSGVRNGLKVSEYKWIIEDYSRKVKPTDWTPYYSPPFYQTVPGYKFMLRGDIDNDNEIKIYLSLLPGEYDHLLTWPIIKTANLTILVNNGTEILHRKIYKSHASCGLQRPTYPSEFRCHTSVSSWSDIWRNKQHISADDTATIKLYMYD